jgi:hypothetical protein
MNTLKEAGCASLPTGQQYHLPGQWDQELHWTAQYGETTTGKGEEPTCPMP